MELEDGPRAAPAVDRCRLLLFREVRIPDPGDRRSSAGEVGGVAETMAQTAARQGRARARSRHVRALCGSKRFGSERSGEMARVNQYLCPLPRARGADRAAAAASTAVADSFLSN